MSSSMLIHRSEYFRSLSKVPCFPLETDDSIVQSCSARSESEEGKKSNHREGDSAEDLGVAALDGDEAELEVVELGTLEGSGVLREERLDGLGGVLGAGDGDPEVSVLG